MPIHGSTLYSRNLTTFILEFWKDDKFNLEPRRRDHFAGALVTHEGRGPTRADQARRWEARHEG